MGGIDSKEVGRVAYRFLYALSSGGFINRLFWIEGDQHVRLMFDVHARLMLQHYASVRDVIVSGGSSSSSPQVAPLDARPIHYAQPHDSAEEDNNEGDSYYVVQQDFFLDEYVPKTSTDGGARFLLPLPLPISQLSKVPSHYHTLSLDAMQLDDPFNAGQGEDYNTNGGLKFQIGHRFRNRDAIPMAVKNYSIRRNMEYRILELDRLKYRCHCKQFTNGCPWSFHLALHQNLNYYTLLFDTNHVSGPCSIG
ncbi:hypothetical protein Ahy_A06g029278 [Arachis hypogaea]|uniref:Transposase MuDR plant domain-containing protein n=1 Tax=Arachis hypogaea TaxID=3818 RepID=A0A445CSW7_ARAHY|nr:hypothetical protein Ahy_A06g029278 [Arachis hypogaea]